LPVPEIVHLSSVDRKMAMSELVGFVWVSAGLSTAALSVRERL
jgi:hypothetical protein